MIRFCRRQRLLRRWPAERAPLSLSAPAKSAFANASNNRIRRCVTPSKRHAKRTSASHLIPVPPTVTIHEKRLIPISPSNNESGGRSGRIHVPLTVTDFHLRHEQLPFAYFFHETLDIEELASSLQRVLEFYPVVGGSIDLSGAEGGAGVYIQCQANGERDTIPLSVGKTDVPLSHWLGEATSHERNYGGSDVMNHEHESGAGHPTLLPLFDPLFLPNTSGASSDRDSDFQNLITVRITHCSSDAGGGTIIGVNINHALADAASCVRLVECWGREMRREVPRSLPRGASNDRSSVTCSGMMSQELMDLLGTERRAAPMNLVPDFAAKYYDDVAALCKDMMSAAQSSMLGAEKKPNETEVPKDNANEHEYVHLLFPPATLDAMKAHGMMQAAKPSTLSADSSQDGPGYVSTNDMVTAVGWLIKRQLSGRADWNMSMIVNLRGRCGVNNFTDIDSAEHETSGVCAKGDPSKRKNERPQKSQSLSKGVFGNGITNVVATQPHAGTGDRPGTSMEGKHASIDAVSSAAMLIREALATGFDGVADRIARSRIGRVKPTPASPDGGAPGVFSTTSWGAFSSLWDIRFSSCANSRMMGFHAHPSHPLPSGNTFSSVIVPTKNGGYVYKLLLPSHLAHDAKKLHHDFCVSFLDWHNDLCA